MYPLILTSPSGLFWPYFAVFEGFTLKWSWGSLLGHNQGWESKFGNIHLPYCKFWILLSSGPLVAFLVFEFKLKTFSNLLGPNDPKKVKKIYEINNLLVLAFDLALRPLFSISAFFGLFRPF